MLRVHQDEAEREQFALDLDEIARRGARRMLAEALEAEVQAYIEAARDERDHRGHALVVRNGYTPGSERSSWGPEPSRSALRLLSHAFLRSSAVQTEVRQPLEMHGWSRNQIQDFGVVLEHPKNNVPEVLQKVETVRNLHGVRSCPPRRFGVLATTIPAHYLHPRMLPEPMGESVRAAVRQDIHQRVAFEIHQDRSVAGAPTESEVVHAQDPGRFVVPELQRADMVQQGVS